MDSTIEWGDLYSIMGEFLFELFKITLYKEFDPQKTVLRMPIKLEGGELYSSKGNHLNLEFNVF